MANVVGHIYSSGEKERNWGNANCAMAKKQAKTDCWAGGANNKKWLTLRYIPMAPVEVIRVLVVGVRCCVVVGISKSCMVEKLKRLTTEWN